MVIEGLIFNGFKQYGIDLVGGPRILVQYNFLGTLADGASDPKTGHPADWLNRSGLHVGPGARDATISDNVLSANSGNGIFLQNASGTHILRNRIGTTSSGFEPLGNNENGILVSSSHDILIGEGNVISGNNQNGVYVSGGRNITIRGNQIGTTLDASSRLQNGGSGVALENVQNALIGGGNTTDWNVISGNNQDGVSVFGGSGVTIFGNRIGTNLGGVSGLGNLGSGISVTNASGVRIGDENQPNRNILSGNHGAGVSIRSDGVVVTGNFIGIGLSNHNALGNLVAGVAIHGGSSNSVLGNTISSNPSGVVIAAGEGKISSRNTIRGNKIGTTPDGTDGAIGNAYYGILLGSAQPNVETHAQVREDGVVSDTTIADNVISGNGRAGVFVVGFTTTGTRITGNKIGTNLDGTRGIANGTIPVAPAAPGTGPLEGGVLIENSSHNLIQANLISGNGQGIIIARHGRGHPGGRFFLELPVPERHRHLGFRAPALAQLRTRGLHRIGQGRIITSAIPVTAT